MCKRITCSNCEKPSWAGCGAHVEQVLGDVAVADRCACTVDELKAAKAREKAARGKAARGKAARGKQPWWKRLVG